jgi:hypothetical protein
MGGSRKSPRGSIVSAAGVVETAPERAVTFMETEQPGQCCQMFSYITMLFYRNDQELVGSCAKSHFDTESEKGKATIL